MSAPLVVNTTDGTVWWRQPEERDGEPLYAIQGAPVECPPQVMATYAELAEHGIAGSADVLPVPVGPEPQADPVAAGRRLDLLALMDDRAASKVSPVLAAVLDEAERLRARVAELEAKLRTLNTQRGDAAQLVERERGLGEECVDIDDLVAALVLGADETGSEAVAESVDKLTALLAPTQALREDGERS